jgi:hypothetical protein
LVDHDQKFPWPRSLSGDDQAGVDPNLTIASDCCRVTQKTSARPNSVVRVAERAHYSGQRSKAREGILIEQAARFLGFGHRPRVPEFPPLATGLETRRHAASCLYQAFKSPTLFHEEPLF